MGALAAAVQLKSTPRTVLAFAARFAGAAATPLEHDASETASANPWRFVPKRRLPGMLDPLIRIVYVSPVGDVKRTCSKLLSLSACPPVIDSLVKLKPLPRHVDEPFETSRSRSLT